MAHSSTTCSCTGWRPTTSCSSSTQETSRRITPGLPSTSSRPAMRLYGNDIDETTTALEADLGWIVGWKKEDFIGAAALRAQKAAGVRRRIVGFELLERGIARHGYEVYTRRAGGGAGPVGGI